MNQNSNFEITGQIESNGIVIDQIESNGIVTSSVIAQKGAKGEDAKINGYNTLNIVAGENVNISQSNNTLEISSDNETNYENFSNLPKINDVLLKGNKTLSDLGIDQDFIKDGNYVHTDNNFTSAEKTKLSGIETGAEVNDIEDVLVNGVSVVENKIASVSVPTKTSNLTNDSNFVSDANYVHTDNNFTDTYKNKITTNESNINTLTSAVEEHDQSIQNIENNIDDLETNKQDKLTFNEEHNIRNVNNNVQVFTDNGNSINDNELYLKNIDVTGTWEFLENEDEVIIGFSNGSDKLLVSQNGGLDFQTITMETIIKDGLYDDKNKLYKLLGNQKVFESSNGIDWMAYPTASEAWDKIEMVVKFTGTTLLIASTTGKVKQCITSSYTGTTYSINKTILKNARINGTTSIMAYATDGTFNYIQNNNLYSLDTTFNDTLNELKNLNDTTYALCSNSNHIYRYKMQYSSIDSSDYWEQITLPDICTTYDITYNNLDGYYYVVADNCNYYKSKDFTNWEKINNNSYHGVKVIKTNEGLIISPQNDNKLLMAPAREKLENRLQQMKRELDKTRWVGNGLELNEEKINVKNGTTILATPNGLEIKTDSIELYYFTEALRLLARTRFADVLDYPLIGTQDYLDEWIWSEEILWEKLFDGPLKAIQVRWSEGGTFEEPYGYMEEYTVEKYERGCFYITDYDELKYVKIGVEEPIGLEDIETALGGI